MWRLPNTRRHGCPVPDPTGVVIFVSAVYDYEAQALELGGAVRFIGYFLRPSCVDDFAIPL